jgi:hypothetical protein
VLLGRTSRMAAPSLGSVTPSLNLGFLSPFFTLGRVTSRKALRSSDSSPVLVVGASARVCNAGRHGTHPSTGVLWGLLHPRRGLQGGGVVGCWRAEREQCQHVALSKAEQPPHEPWRERVLLPVRHTAVGDPR